MNNILQLLGIQYPIIQGGMVWASGWRLVSAVSNAGGLGLLGAGSMYPEVLVDHIQKCKKATKNPFGVNIPMLYPQIEQLIQICVDQKIKIVVTAAGNPNIYTSFLKKKGIIVIHVVSSLKFAHKAQEAGVDAIIAEGFEAGGHNGREETTTLTLIPLLRKHIRVPLVAAGGIATGAGMYAAMALGADGVQIGSRFVASEEASSHHNFKTKVIQAKEGDTQLTLKELAPVRLLKNKLYDEIQQVYQNSGSIQELKNLLRKGQTKSGMFEGNLETGKLEIGQVSALIDSILPVSQIINNLRSEYLATQERMTSMKSLFKKNAN